MGIQKKSVSVRIPKDDLDELEEFVENSITYENRSHAIRVAVRRLINEETGEFEPTT